MVDLSLYSTISGDFFALVNFYKQIQIKSLNYPSTNADVKKNLILESRDSMKHRESQTVIKFYTALNRTFINYQRELVAWYCLKFILPRLMNKA